MTKKQYKFLWEWADKEIKEWTKFKQLLFKEYEKNNKKENK